MPSAGRLSGRLPASTARTTKFVGFDTVSAAAIGAPSALENAGVGYEDPGDVLVLAFVTDGSVASITGRDTVVRTRGDMAVSQLTRVDEVGLTRDFRSVSLRFASGLIDTASREVDWLMRRRFSQTEPIPRLLGAMCRELLTPGSTLGPATTTALTQSVASLCAGFFDDALGRNSPPERTSRNLVSRALDFIRISAASPGIDPQRVAVSLAVSVRTLHKAFENEPQTVAQAILAARLTKAEALLQGATLRMDEVASLSGFASPSSFSRAFRRAHGMPPRDWRRAHRERT